MAFGVTKITVPQYTEISKVVAGAFYVDCYQVPTTIKSRSALQVWLDHVAKTPRWINWLMSVRNSVVAAFGLKDLGLLGAIDPEKSSADYQVGDRVGIFTLIAISENEIILADCDKHLDVKLSVYQGCTEAVSSQETVIMSTVVHTHNLLGKVYMFFVAPVHKIIVPLMLARSELS